MAQPPHGQGQPGLQIGGAPPDARFYISTVPAMPRIALTAQIAGMQATGPVTFTWRFALAYTAYITSRPGQRGINVRPKTHPPIAPITSANPDVVVPFSTLMCGWLTVTLTATVNGRQLTATRDDILIGGTNPDAATLTTALPDPIVRQMVMQESGRKQFSDTSARVYVAQAINPNWSSDGFRGVGLGQLTVPAPSDDDIWNWRANARSLQQRYEEKKRGADRFAGQFQTSARFIREVAALNAWRATEGHAPLRVTMPALTRGERERWGLRGYNGYGPTVPGEYLRHVHEYEPATNRYRSARTGAGGAPVMSPELLAVDANGVGSWAQISGAERRRRYTAQGRGVPGEPDYVAQVLAQPA